MRIVSLLPSATEILFAVGAGAEVVGVTFECDYPPAARERTIVSTSALPENLTPREIDGFVSAAIERGDDLYHLDAGALAGLDADLVITQDLCAVCAVDVSVVNDALAYLGCRAEMLTTDPHTLEQVLESILTIGRATGHLERAQELVEDQRARLNAVRDRTCGRPRPRVLLLEWTDPPFTPGHWVPEMIEAAGGQALLGLTGQKSQRIDWDQVHGCHPDVIVVAPCGYDRAGAQQLADQITPLLPAGIPVHAVDANASWARPGTRLVDGVEELATLLHPGLRAASEEPGSLDSPP